MVRRKYKFYLNQILIMLLILMSHWIIKINSGKLPYLDLWTRRYVELLKDTPIFTLLRAITELGSSTFLIPFTIVGSLTLMILFKRSLPALMLSLGTLGTYLLNELIKQIIKRERPSIWIEANAEGYSFPSGHSMIPVVCFGLFIYYLNKKIHSQKLIKLIKAAGYLLIISIGLSRYVINVHYLTDILMGFIIGGGCLLLLIALDNYLSKISDLRRR